MRRHESEIRLAVTKGLDIQRLTSDLSESIEQFCIDFEQFIREHNLRETCIFNADETSMIVGSSTKFSMKVVAKKISRLGTLMNKMKSHITMKPFINAAGRAIMIVYILQMPKTKSSIGIIGFSVEKCSYSLRGSIQQYYVFTENGFMTNKAWENIMVVFSQQVRIGEPTSDMALITDRPPSHL